MAMSKFLSVYINAADISGGANLIPADGVINVLQTSATVVTINFRDAAAGFQTVALTHTALPAYAVATPEESRAMRNLFAFWVANFSTTSDNHCIFCCRTLSMCICGCTRFAFHEGIHPGVVMSTARPPVDRVHMRTQRTLPRSSRSP